MVTPADWKEVRLGDLGSTYGGLSGKSAQDFRSGDASYVTFLNVMSNVVLRPSGTGQVHVRFGEAQSRLQVGDVIFNGSSETPEEVGFGAAVPAELEGAYLNSFCFGLRCYSGSDLDAKFLAYLTRSPAGRAVIRPMAQGSTRYNLAKTNLLNGRFLLPPLKEQEAIAEALSDADAAIEALDGLIAKKRDVKQAAMQQLLTGRTRLPGYSGEWQQLGFDRILQRSRGTEKAIPAGEYTSVGVLPIIDQSQAAVAGWTDRVDLRVHCPARGVIVFGDHTRVVKFVGTDFVVGADGTQVLIPSGDGDARFLAYLLQQAEIPNTGYNRHFKFLRDLTLSCPAGAEQRAIAEALADMDSEIDALVAERDKVRLVKQGMMQELLSGRVRLV